MEIKIMWRKNVGNIMSILSAAGTKDAFSEPKKGKILVLLFNY